MDTKPQRMDHDRRTVLRDIAGLVARELGKDRQAAQQQRTRQLRAKNSCQQALMVVDVAAPGWRVLHMSQQASERTGAYTWRSAGGDSCADTATSAV